MSGAKPKVAVIATGGTIATQGEHSLDLVEYRSGVLATADLLARIPELEQTAELVSIPYAAVGSDAIGPEQWLALTREIESQSEAQPDLRGIVVTHGTATLEETAYFLNLSLKVSLPVVVVGAQRPITGLSTDGPLNLVNAVRVAANDASRGLGVLVLLNDEIHAAREVTKSSVYRLHAFQTPEFGALGHADPDVVSIYRRPVRRHAPDTEFDLTGIDSLPRVDIVPSYAGADGAAISAFVEAGAHGLVFSALAPGWATPAQAEALQEAHDRGVIIVYSTRAAGGRVLPLRKHHVEGSVTADNLSPQKARILLMLALTRSRECGEIQRMFGDY